VKVAADRAACVGHAQCSAVCPSVFGNDELGYVVLRDDGRVPPGDEDDARLAVESCPERALAVVDG
jgi:ferredoxin